MDTFRTFIRTLRRFRFEPGRNSLYVLVPFVGALWIGGGLPFCADGWRTLRRIGEV